MKDALDTIKSEHRSLAMILNAMRALVARIRNGSAPDFNGLRAMLYYVDTFSSRQHHPNEDEFLFQPLRACSGDAGAILDDVEREHVRAAVALRSLEQALLRYEAGGAREFVDFATAVEGFCEFYLRHMHKEEALVMPLAENLFAAEEWARIDAACAAAHAPQGGVDEDQEFRQLFRRIVGLVRAPAGTGPQAPQL